MTRRTQNQLLLLLSLMMPAIGCSRESDAEFVSEHAPHETPTRESLRKLLAPEFSLKSVPKDKEDQFYIILGLFAKTRLPDEFVREFGIEEPKASMTFANSGMHGGGVILFKMLDGKWTVGDKCYFE